MVFFFPTSLLAVLRTARLDVSMVGRHQGATTEWQRILNFNVDNLKVKMDCKTVKRTLRPPSLDKMLTKVVDAVDGAG